MPSKKKYNARFPPARIKKIMQTDEDIGKVAAPVPVILSKALEIFMQSLLETACKNTQARHAKTMSTAHLYHSQKQCITSESQFDFLKELVENIPDLPTNEEEADDLDEPKPKRKRTSATVTRKEKVPRKERKKKEKEVESESDEDSQSEEEEGSNSTGSGSNTGIPSNTLSDASNSSSSFPKPMQTKRNDHFIPPKNLLEPSSSTSSSPSLQIPNTSIPVPSLYRPVHSEDDDYDS